MGDAEYRKANAAFVGYLERLREFRPLCAPRVHRVQKTARCDYMRYTQSA